MTKARIKQQVQDARENATVEIYGWVKSKRESKNLVFLVVNDGSQMDDLQVVADIRPDIADALKEAVTGSSVKITGEWRASPGKGQKWEVGLKDIAVFGSADPETYPLQKKGHSLEFLRDIAHLRVRTNTFGAVFRIRNALSFMVHEFFQKRGFVWVHTPIITANDCEGAGELFQVTTLKLNELAKKSGNGVIDFSQDFFGKPTHLTVSGQLEGEIFAHGLRDIYTFGPTFRAENSNTTRHLAEFWMIEPEVAFADLTDNMDLAESFLKSMFREVLKHCSDDLAFLAKHYKDLDIANLERISESKFERMTYTDAINELTRAKKQFEFPVKWGMDMQSEHERYLTDEVFKSPVIVTNYPQGIKAFYMRLNADEKTVAAMDVLAPKIGEIIGGSQREDRLPLLQKRMQDMNIPSKDLNWYMDLRRYGSTPHAGFGLGFERLVQYVTGMGNIRDVIPFPRTPQNCHF